jgi:hypothetical protein
VNEGLRMCPPRHLDLLHQRQPEPLRDAPVHLPFHGGRVHRLSTSCAQAISTTRRRRARRLARCPVEGKRSACAGTPASPRSPPCRARRRSVAALPHDRRPPRPPRVATSPRARRTPRKPSPAGAPAPRRRPTAPRRPRSTSAAMPTTRPRRQHRCRPAARPLSRRPARSWRSAPARSRDPGRPRPQRCGPCTTGSPPLTDNRTRAVP